MRNLIESANYWLGENTLLEISSEDKYTRQYDGKLDRKLFDKAVSLDPTSNGSEKVGKYVDWIIRQKAWNNSDITDLLTNFDKYKTKIDMEYRDINKMDVNTLESVISKALEQGGLSSKKDKKNDARKKAEEESEVVFNDDNYIVVVPETKFASRYYGAGSDWCTARQDDSVCMFDHYDRRGTLYIIMDKYNKQKYQMFVADKKSGGGREYEYKDSNNDTFNPWDTFSGDILDFFDKKGIPNGTQLTEEQIKDLTYDLVIDVGISNGSEYYNDAYDVAEGIVRGFNDYGDINDIYEFAREDIGNISYSIVQALDYLNDTYGIDKYSDKNKIMVLSHGGSSDVSYDVKHGYDMWDPKDKEEGLFSFDWDMIYDNAETIDDLGEVLSNISYNLDIVTAWYKSKYDSLDVYGDEFVDQFIKSYEDNHGRDDIDIHELKSSINSIDKTQRETDKTAPQQTLDLSHRIYTTRGLKYINHYFA